MLHFFNSFIVLFLTVGVLGSPFVFGATPSDAQLEVEIQREYSTYTGEDIPGLTTRPAKTVQFLYHLLKSDDPNAPRKMAMIIGRGAGVGGIRTKGPGATDEERRVILTAFSKALSEDVSEGTFGVEAIDPTIPLGQHQTYVAQAYNYTMKMAPRDYTPFK